MEKDIKTDVGYAGFTFCRAAWARKSILLCSMLVPTPQYSTITPRDFKISPYIAISTMRISNIDSTARLDVRQGKEATSSQ